MSVVNLYLDPGFQSDRIRIDMTLKDRLLFKIVAALFVSTFLFLVVGAEVFHNHEDGEHHNNCLVCKWLAVLGLVFLVIVILLGFVFPPQTNYRKTTFIPYNGFLDTFRFLRSPPPISL